MHVNTPLYTARLYVNTTEEQKRRVMQLAAERGIKYSDLIREALEYYLKHHPNGKGG